MFDPINTEFSKSVLYLQNNNTNQKHQKKFKLGIPKKLMIFADSLFVPCTVYRDMKNKLYTV